MSAKLKLKPLNEQVIVITGASSGIGLTTAEQAAKEGATVVLVSRDEQALSQISQRLQAAGGNVTFFACDVADQAGLQRVADETIRQFGRIDTWVNNAGLSIFGKVWDVSDADNRKLFETNFWGLVYGSLIALPHLRQNGGALINLGSEVSEAVIPFQVMYSSSKHAIKGFTDGLRLELEMENAPVSVTLIQPTAVNTPYAQHAKNYLPGESLLPHPQIEPEKVADAILNAAVSPERDVKVGFGSHLNTNMANVAPRVAGFMAKKLAPSQIGDQPDPHPQGSLYAPAINGDKHGHPQSSPAK